ncbi:hypothetical protein FRB96_007007 [Tulasnella sp. 330]|nr:hypothetical protein FRB96_007007 [Tulasnella sp. 330]
MSDGESWYDCYKEDVLKQAWQAKREDAQHHYRNLPEITLFCHASQIGILPSVLIPESKWTGRKPVISPTLADTPCADLGVDALLTRLNTVLGTSYDLGMTGLSVFLERCCDLAAKTDFGTAFAHLRPSWYRTDNWERIAEEFDQRSRRDYQMRQSVFHNNRILNRWLPPRHVWDLYSNRVVPWSMSGIDFSSLWTVSHAWVIEEQREGISTTVNGMQWPVPMPRGMPIERIRIELLNNGAEYAWLDVLCLRQAGGADEERRMREWRVDVPTIGHTYERAFYTLIYFSGLGVPLRRSLDLTSDRSWFRRAWTMQEIQVLRENIVIGGLGGQEAPDGDTGIDEEAQRILEAHLALMRDLDHFNIFALLSEMQRRVSTTPVDRVAGLSYLLRADSIPPYYETQDQEDAWSALIAVLGGWEKADLFFLYPRPGDHKARWHPSWNQVLSDTIPTENGSCGPVNSNSVLEDTYEGLLIQRAEVLGLAEAQLDRSHREGELCLLDSDGSQHCVKITAPHQHPIPGNAYSLIGSSTNGKCWVVGHMNEDRFTKVSTFQIFDRAERQRLLSMRVVRKYAKIILV